MLHVVATWADTISGGALSSSVVGHHGSPLFSASCSFYDLDLTDMYMVAKAVHVV